MAPPEIGAGQHPAKDARSPVARTLVSNQVLGLLGFITLALVVWSVSQSRISQARAAARAGRWDEVARLAKLVLRRRPSDPEAAYLYARAALERTPRRLETALAWARSLPHDRRWAERAWQIEGMALWRMSRAAQAEAVWSRWRDARPAAVLPCWYLSRFYEMQERRAEARAMALEYYRRSGDMIGGLVELMRQATERPEPAMELKLWTACVAQDPDDYYSRRALGICHVFSDAMDRGLPHLEWCIRRRPEDLEGFDALIWAHLERGDLAAARDLLGRLPPGADADARFWGYRARVAADQGQWDQVVNDYTRALAVNPFDPKSHYHRLVYYELGQALQHLGRRREAANWLDKAHKLNAVWARAPQVYDPLSNTPDPSPEQCYQAALFCDLVGFLPEARGWYQEVLRRQPRNASSHAALAVLTRLEMSFQPPG